MSSYLTEEDYSKYSAFEEAGSTTIADSTTFAAESKVATGSTFLADVNFNRQHLKSEKQQTEYSRDEFLYALSSPSSIGAMAWILSSFFAVIYGSSIIVYLNFCIPLLVGPYVIKEQMPAQLLPSVRRKFNKVRSEANAIATVNLQLKSIVSRMQRQEYRLSAAEERFEHLCKRSEKDIVKMKQLARKNAALRQKIKDNLAEKKLQELLKNTLSENYSAKNSIRKKDIHDVVMLIKNFAGKNSSLNFDKDAIKRAVVNIIVKNSKPAFISKLEPHIETRQSESEYDEGDVDDVNEENHLYRNDEETEESSYLSMDKFGKLHDGMADYDTKGEDSLSMTESNQRDHLQQRPQAKERFRNTMQTNANNGTMDQPIDIEQLLFEKNIPKVSKGHEESRYYRSEKSEILSMVSSVE